MRARTSVANAARLRRTLQRIGAENGEIVEPVKAVLRRSAESLKRQIEYNIVSQGLVDEGDLLESVALIRRSNGFSYRVGFTRKGALRLWRRAGFRAHFAEFGTRYPYRPARPFVGPAARTILPTILPEIDRAVDAALDRLDPM